jgi:hypothetical protein
MAKQRDCKGNISPEGSQHSPSCVVIPRVVQETEALEHRLAFSFGNTVFLRKPAPPRLHNEHLGLVNHIRHLYVTGRTRLLQFSTSLLGAT